MLASLMNARSRRTAGSIRITPAAIGRNLDRLPLDREALPLEWAPEIVLAAAAMDEVPDVAKSMVSALVDELTRAAGADYVEGFLAGFGCEDIGDRRRSLRFVEGLEDGGYARRHVATFSAPAGAATIAADPH